MDTQQEQLDPSVVALTKAIGRQESGGKYDKVGDNGHSYGAYQWNNPKPLKKGEIPANFYEFAKNVGADPNDFSPANQDRVAYKTVEAWGKQGLKPAQIASKWNSGREDAYKTAKPGFNAEQGVKYDVKGYVDSVAKYYDEYRGQEGQNDEGYITSAEIPESAPQANTGPLGTNKGDSTGGKIIDNSVTRGLVDFVPGAKTLGASIGTLGGLAYEKLKGATGGQDNSKYYDTSAPTPWETSKAAAETVGTAMAIKGVGGLAQKALNKSKAVNHPLVEKAMGNFRMTMSEFKSLSKAEQLDALTEALKLTKGTSSKLVLEKAIQEVAPSALRELGLAPSLAKSAIKAGARGVGKLIRNVGGVAVGAAIGSGGFNKLKEKVLGR